MKTQSMTHGLTGKEISTMSDKEQLKIAMATILKIQHHAREIEAALNESIERERELREIICVLMEQGKEGTKFQA